MKKNDCMNKYASILLLVLISTVSMSAFAQDAVDEEAAALLADDVDDADTAALLEGDSEEPEGKKESAVPTAVVKVDEPVEEETLPEPETSTETSETKVATDSAIKKVADKVEEAVEDSDSDDSGSGLDFLEAFSSSETIFVIQKKSRLVKGTFEITPQLMQSVSDRFVSHTGFLVGAAYHFKESFSLQLDMGAFGWWDDPSLYFQDFNSEAAPRIGGRLTTMSTELQDRERLTGELVNYYWMTWLTGVSAQWSAVRGKMSIHDMQLGDFSLFLSVGGGLAGYHNPLAPKLKNALGMDFLGPVRLFSSVGLGLRFYFFDWLGLQFEVKDYIQPLSLVEVDVNNQPNAYDGPTFSIRHTVMAQAGLSFVLPSFNNLY